VNLINDYKDIFRVGIDGSAPMKVKSYLPVLTPAFHPTKAKARRYPPVQMRFLREFISKYERLGILKRNGKSLWSSPVYLTPKGESFRFTVDLKKVNKNIVPRAWPMPMLDQDLNLAVKAGFFAKLDADNGYWQILNDPQLEDIWTISTPFGLYTSTRLLQGGVDGVAVFQEAMSQVLKDHIQRTVCVWIDDVIVFEESPERLCIELRKIFQSFREFSVKINPIKTELLRKDNL
jgi:hypothetical protein